MDNGDALDQNLLIDKKFDVVISMETIEHFIKKMVNNIYLINKIIR